MAYKKLSIGVVVLGVLYSITFCDSSNILKAVRPKSRDSDAGASRHFQDNAYQAHPELKKIMSRAFSASKAAIKKPSNNVTSAFTPVASKRVSQTPSSGRQFGGYGGGGSYGGSGWGWPGYYYKDNNADLYSMLAGLAFLTALLSALLSGTSTNSSIQIVNATGRRRRRSTGDSNIENGLGFMDILKSVGIALNNPWWQGEPELDLDRVDPFPLV